MSRLVRSLAVAGILWLTATTASAVTLTVIDGGLTNPDQNYACLAGAALCQFPPALFLDAPAAATGSITLNAALTSASEVLDIDFVRFNLDNPTPNDTDFTDLAYTATIPIAVYGGTVFQAGIASGSISGFANGTPFVVTPQITNFTCGSVTSPTQCGIQFGENGFTVLGLDFAHTFNVLVTPVPEPALGLLVLVGLVGLAARARAE
jgi:hypothetical protein